jgi:ADP-ribosylglycohydrolase
MSELIVQAQAALLAAAAGDALGWAQEGRGGLVGGKAARESRKPEPFFRPWNRTGGSRFLRYPDPVAAGEYSDDTQLILAVSRSCLQGPNWARHLAEVELPIWPLYQRGGGRAVLSAANAWSTGRPPWIPKSSSDGVTKVRQYLDAGANGVAMRILPHVIWCRVQFENTGERLLELHRRVVLDGITTHGHPRALVGALAYASALDYAFQANGDLRPDDLAKAAHRGLLNGKDVAEWFPAEWSGLQSRDALIEVWNHVNDEMSSLLHQIRDSLSRGAMSSVDATLESLGALSRENGSGTITAASAIFLAGRSGTRPLSGLLQAAFAHGADTDTLASMVGALLGAVHGTNWLGDLQGVQDSEYIADIARRLATGQEETSSGKAPISARELYRTLDNPSEKGGVFPDSRLFRVLGRERLSEAPGVVRVRLQFDDGQTVTVDRVHRNIAAQPRNDRVKLVPDSGHAKERGADSVPRASDGPTTIGVTLPTADLEATRLFYSQLLGKELKTIDGAVSVSPTIKFVELSQPSLWGADVQIDLLHDGNDQPDQSESDQDKRDPDGRTIRYRDWTG